jgi:hypothetical protein
MKSLLKLQALMEDVPAQVQQILVDVESGKFRVNVHSVELDRIASNIRQLGLTLFMGLFASALIVGGFFAFSRDFAPFRGLRFLGGAALALAGAIFGMALAVYLLGGTHRKIQLRRFLRRGRR